MATARKIQTPPFDFVHNATLEKALLRFIECLITNNGDLARTKEVFTETNTYNKLAERWKGRFLAAVETKINDLRDNRDCNKTTVSKIVLEKFDGLDIQRRSEECHDINFNKDTCPPGTSNEQLRNFLESMGFLKREVEIYKKGKFITKGTIDPTSIFYTDGSKHPCVKLYNDENNKGLKYHRNVTIVKAS